VGLSYARFPASIHGLIGALVGAASRLGFHGKAKITREGARYVITLLVQHGGVQHGGVQHGGIPHVTDVLDEMSERERKRRARAVRG